MISIDNKLISNQVIEAEFVCDLIKCKGGCCEDGDAGAPLEIDELQELIENYEKIKPFLSEEGNAEIERQGKYIYDVDFNWVTPTINSGVCAYGIKEENGIIKCGIERSFNEGKSTFKKPLSCHLFPLRIRKSAEQHGTEYINYEPRKGLCNPACRLGEKLKIPVFAFLKEAIIRKYGAEFYESLSATAAHLKEQTNRLTNQRINEFK